MITPREVFLRGRKLAADLIDIPWKSRDARMRAILEQVQDLEPDERSGVAITALYSLADAVSIALEAMELDDDVLKEFARRHEALRQDQIQAEVNEAFEALAREFHSTDQNGNVSGA